MAGLRDEQARISWVRRWLPRTFSHLAANHDWSVLSVAGEGSHNGEVLRKSESEQPGTSPMGDIPASRPLDSLERFLAEACVLDPSLKTRALALQFAYRWWCRDNGLKTVTNRRWSAVMRAKFTVEVRQRQRGRAAWRWWAGVGLRGRWAIGATEVVRRWVRCEHCGQLFLDRGLRGVRPKFCSKRHQMDNWRLRHRQAQTPNYMRRLERSRTYYHEKQKPAREAARQQVVA